MTDAFDRETLDALRRRLFDLELALAERREADLPDGYAGALDDAFRETGASGRWWTRDGTLELLASGAPTSVTIEDFEVELLAPGAALATYRTVGSRPARRASVWVNDGRRWRIRYHQGTLL